MFRHRKLVPNINFNKPNPRINFKDWNLKVVTEKISFPKDKQISIILVLLVQIHVLFYLNTLKIIITIMKWKLQIC